MTRLALNFLLLDSARDSETLVIAITSAARELAEAETLGEAAVPWLHGVAALPKASSIEIGIEIGS